MLALSDQASKLLVDVLLELLVELVDNILLHVGEHLKRFSRAVNHSRPALISFESICIVALPWDARRGSDWHSDQ